MASIKASQSWAITDIQCHFFIQPTLSGSKIETATLMATYDPNPKIFSPWTDCWGQESDIFEACPGDCYRRHQTAAGCNIRWAVAHSPSMSSFSSFMPRLHRSAGDSQSSSLVRWRQKAWEDCLFFQLLSMSFQPTGSNFSCQELLRTTT